MSVNCKNRVSRFTLYRKHKNRAKIPVTDRTGPRTEARLGKMAANTEGAAGMEEAMAAPVADTEVTTTVDTAVTAATTLLPNVAVATTGEVAEVDGTAAAPAGVVTATSE
jgi:hypothetical protein